MNTPTAEGVIVGFEAAYPPDSPSVRAAEERMLADAGFDGPAVTGRKRAAIIEGLGNLRETAQFLIDEFATGLIDSPDKLSEINRASDKLIRNASRLGFNAKMLGLAMLREDDARHAKTLARVDLMHRIADRAAPVVVGPGGDYKRSVRPSCRCGSTRGVWKEGETTVCGECGGRV